MLCSRCLHVLLLRYYAHARVPTISCPCLHTDSVATDSLLRARTQRPVYKGTGLVGTRGDARGPLDCIARQTLLNAEKTFDLFWPFYSLVRTFKNCYKSQEHLHRSIIIRFYFHFYFNRLFLILRGVPELA